MPENWLLEWFDSKYYRLLYHYRDEKEAGDFIKNLMNFIDLPSRSKVLDICCGRGRHAVKLQKFGFEVTGIDISEPNIAEARQRARPGMKFFCHDKRNVFTEGGFDLALNLFTSFGYAKNRNDLEATFQNMLLNVKPGGLFVLDFLNATKLRKTVQSFAEVEIEGIHFGISREINENRIVKTIEVNDNGTTRVYKESVELFDQSDFRSLFAKSGFEILHTFGDYNLNVFELQQSDRLIIIARRIG